ncbi:hypothetical protein VHUM_02970 [Vanrija humicola]|uniref:m7GpppX diphosphatase n=1 Tax=Vanrija humicola TaxID=5417 RepID=A0A7D8Z2B3_VANHU|nr:hypothetical protein VHUM_02970 [Vanrija humicola]
MESTTTGSLYLLGTLHGEQAIVHVQRTAIASDAAPALVKNGLENVNVFLENRPYFSANALITRTADSLPDLALKVIWPATDVHVKKYTAQARRVLRETPAAYASVVAPYIASFSPDRLEWVYAILEGRKEADRVLFRDEDPATGFVLTPDLKWDGETLSALYLTALVQTREIRSIRDLTREHIPLLCRIEEQAYATAAERYGVEKGQLRLFVHYQPSYYHFHVHIVHVHHEIMAGMAVGQAHMLADVINWLELSPPSPAPSLLAQMTFNYALGTEHGLYAGLLAAQDGK